MKMPPEGNESRVFDPIRHKDVTLSPEETVRQALIAYLTDIVKVPPNLIGVEYSLANLEPGNFRRVDIVVWRPGAGGLAPWLLVECKKPGLPIDESVAQQAAGYLARIACRFVMLSNGRDTRYLERDGSRYREVSGLPIFTLK